jgi:hypothetical protein
LDGQFGCAANRLLQWHAFSMCSKNRGLSQKSNTALHATLHAVLHAALHAFPMSFSISNMFLTWVLKKARSPALRAAWCRICAARRLAARLAAMFAAFSVIGHKFWCTSKTQVIAADSLLRIQAARSKRKCNRPLKEGIPPFRPKKRDPFYLKNLKNREKCGK